MGLNFKFIAFNVQNQSLEGLEIGTKELQPLKTASIGIQNLQELERKTLNLNRKQPSLQSLSV